MTLLHEKKTNFCNKFCILTDWGFVFDIQCKYFSNSSLCNDSRYNFVMTDFGQDLKVCILGKWIYDISSVSTGCHLGITMSIILIYFHSFVPVHQTLLLLVAISYPWIRDQIYYFCLTSQLDLLVHIVTSPLTNLLVQSIKLYTVFFNLHYYMYCVSWAALICCLMVANLPWYINSISLHGLYCTVILSYHQNITIWKFRENTGHS